MQVEPSRDTNPPPDRRTMIRDIAVLQVKLFVDGVRDFLLIPVSLVAGIVSLVKAGNAEGNAFYDLLKLGRRSERWIDLFGAAERVHGPAGRDDDLLPESIDAMVDRMERFVVDEYQRGGVTRQAKEQLDRALDSVQKLASRRQRNDGDDATP